MRKWTQYVGALLLGGLLSNAWAEPLDLNTADAKALAEVMVGAVWSRMMLSVAPAAEMLPAPSLKYVVTDHVPSPALRVKAAVPV